MRARITRWLRALWHMSVESGAVRYDTFGTYTDMED